MTGRSSAPPGIPRHVGSRGDRASNATAGVGCCPASRWIHLKVYRQSTRLVTRRRSHAASAQRLAAALTVTSSIWRRIRLRLAEPGLRSPVQVRGTGDGGSLRSLDRRRIGTVPARYQLPMPNLPVSRQQAASGTCVGSLAGARRHSGRRSLLRGAGALCPTPPRIKLEWCRCVVFGSTEPPPGARLAR